MIELIKAVIIYLKVTTIHLYTVLKNYNTYLILSNYIHKNIAILYDIFPLKV